MLILQVQTTARLETQFVCLYSVHLRTSGWPFSAGGHETNETTSLNTHHCAHCEMTLIHCVEVLLNAARRADGHYHNRIVIRG